MLRMTLIARFLTGMALGQAPPTAPGRGGRLVGDGEGVRRRTSSRAAATTSGGPVAEMPSPTEAGPAGRDQGQGEVAGPVANAPAADEEGGGDGLPDDVLEGQLAGEPAGEKAEDGAAAPA